MTTTKPSKLMLPAVKGKMGKRDYILCPMPLTESVARIEFAVSIVGGDILPSEQLQRELKEKRFEGISKYLLTNNDRFFAPLVVALCGDTARWLSFQTLEGEGIDDRHKTSLGFLSLSGEERMYALDGQHRLMGMMKALENKQSDNLRQDLISLLIVHHDENKTVSGVAASRRLFTVLNKHAEKTSKKDMIYLDEDNLPASVVRKLIEDKKHSSLFALRERIHQHTVNQFSKPDETSCFTTVGAFYDCVLEILARHTGRNKKLIENEQVSQSEISAKADVVNSFFVAINACIPEMQRYFDLSQPPEMEKFVREHNKKHVLFRPMGLKVFVETVCAYHKRNSQGKTMEECVEICSKLPFYMENAPLANLVWNVKQQKVVNGYPILKKIYAFMLGDEKIAKAKLEKEYQDKLGNDNAKLPNRIQNA